MQPSSLIFLVLIAIWAAYLLQHWVRRREHLATARSVDRFSDAMHVLERRSGLPELDLSAPRLRSYAVSPARPSPPEAVVKRARSLRPHVPTGSPAAVRPTRIFHVLAGVSARRLRGFSLLASLALTLVVAALVAVSVLPWWGLLVGVIVLFADLAWLRHAAVSERTYGRAAAPERRSAEGPDRPPSRQPTYFESDPEPEPEVASAGEPDPEPEAQPEPAAAGVVAGAVTGAADQGEPIEPPVQADPSDWAPVPVPPPTYTLKAKAADPVIEPAVVTEPGQTGPWSLEGLVYDCELDELVERRSATGA